MRIIPTFSAITAALALATAYAPPARAQQPQQPAPPNVTGRVQEPSGAPIEGAQVELEGVSIRARTGETGAFSFSNVKKGTHELTVRRVGFLAVTHTISVESTPVSIEIQMVRSTPTLDTVLVQAKVKVLAGVVADSAGHPIPDARVEMLGASHGTTTSGPDGWFRFTDVRTGPIVLRALKAGWAAGKVSVRFEESRGVVIHLDALDTLRLTADKALQLSGLGNSDAAAWTETQMRMVGRSGRATVISRQELEAFDELPLGQAIQRTPSGQMISIDLQATYNEACILLDGRRVVGNATLDTYHAEDVEFVELYPPGTEATGSVGRYLRSAGCRAVVTSGMRRGVFYAVVWTR